MVSFTLFDRVKAGTRVADDLMDLDKTASETLLESLRKEAVHAMVYLDESVSITFRDWQFKEDNPSIEDTRQALADVADLLSASYDS